MFSQVLVWLHCFTIFFSRIFKTNPPLRENNIVFNQKIKLYLIYPYSLLFIRYSLFHISIVRHHIIYKLNKTPMKNHYITNQTNRYEELPLDILFCLSKFLKLTEYDVLRQTNKYFYGLPTVAKKISSR